MAYRTTCRTDHMAVTAKWSEHKCHSYQGVLRQTFRWPTSTWGTKLRRQAPRQQFITGGKRQLRGCHSSKYKDWNHLHPYCHEIPIWPVSWPWSDSCITYEITVKNMKLARHDFLLCLTHFRICCCLFICSVACLSMVLSVGFCTAMGWFHVVCTVLHR